MWLLLRYPNNILDIQVNTVITIPVFQEEIKTVPKFPPPVVDSGLPFYPSSHKINIIEHKRCKIQF